VDSALVAAIASPLHLNTGHLLENLAFVHFRRSGEPIHYHRTRSGKEVDFVLGDHRRGLRVVQVCEDLGREETRAREVGALAEAMGELKIKEGVLVTLSGTETIRIPQGTIRVLPAWRFILDS
jgi:predicted AAA+ superfamily ATPase